MITGRPLERLFGGNRAAVLQVLLEIGEVVSVRHVARLAGISATTASDALQTLERLRFVERTDAGGWHAYKLADGNVMVPHLRAMMSDAHIIDRDFGRIVVEMLDQQSVLAVVLYGSVARGDDVAESDVDLLVVAKSVDIEQWTPIVEQAELRLARYIGRPIHIVVTNWPGKIEQKNTFWRHVRADGRALAGARAKELIDD